VWSVLGQRFRLVNRTTMKKATWTRWLQSNDLVKVCFKLGAQKRTRTSTMLLAST